MTLGDSLQDITGLSDMEKYAGKGKFRTAVLEAH